VARFAKLFQPRLIIVENVQAVLHDAGKVVKRTRTALTKLGYVVDDAVVRATDIGVAQTRRRHILVAVRPDAVDSEIPGISTIVDRFRVPPRPVLWAIGDLTKVRSDGVFDAAAKPAPETRRRIRWLFEHRAYELANAERPECHQGEHRYTAVYGRMRPGEPAPTITGGYDTMGRGRFVHPIRRRTITPHEAARIQFFPDFFDFSPAAHARARLAQVIGNAVPPKLSYVLAVELLR
jgi:DNA (cytosine-5)-methyltransferase 1